MLPNGVLADSDNEFIMVNSFLPSDEKQLCGKERVIPASTSVLPVVSIIVCRCQFHCVIVRNLSIYFHRTSFFFLSFCLFVYFVVVVIV